jgi:hypothetical protein
MKKIVVAIITLGLLLAPLSAAQAQTNEHYINLVFSDDTVYLEAGDNVILGHGWGACTRGLVQMYLTAVHTELSITTSGNEFLAYTADGRDQYWGTINSAPDANWVPSCIAGNQNTSSVVHWYYPLGSLEQGEYEVHFYYWLERNIHDGTDIDGDGSLDIFGGVIVDRTITIIVE